MILTVDQMAQAVVRAAEKAVEDAYAGATQAEKDRAVAELLDAFSAAMFRGPVDEVAP